MMKIEWNIFCTRAKTTNDNHFKELEGFNECVGGLCMIIRQEQYADYDEVYELVKTSFATSTNEGEWDYLNEVRKKDTFIPELSLVAENDDGKLVGQIVLYKTCLLYTSDAADE